MDNIIYTHINMWESFEFWFNDLNGDQRCMDIYCRAITQIAMIFNEQDEIDHSWKFNLN